MSKFSTRLTYLFHRYYAGEATQAETDEFFGLVQSAKDDQELNDLLADAWEQLNGDPYLFNNEHSDKIIDSIISKEYQEEDEEQEAQIIVRSFYWWRYAAAAILFIFGFAAVYKFQHRPAIQSAEAVRPVVKDVLPGGNRAMLTLADGSTIVLDSAANGVLARQGNTEVSKEANGQLVYNASRPENKPASDQMNVLSTPKGGQYQIVLPDGSKVWLNSSSSIKFPAVFSKQRAYRGSDW